MQDTVFSELTMVLRPIVVGFLEWRSALQSVEMRANLQGCVHRVNRDSLTTERKGDIDLLGTWYDPGSANASDIHILSARDPAINRVRN